PARVVTVRPSLAGYDPAVASGTPGRDGLPLVKDGAAVGSPLGRPLGIGRGALGRGRDVCRRWLEIPTHAAHSPCRANPRSVGLRAGHRIPALSGQATLRGEPQGA